MDEVVGRLSGRISQEVELEVQDGGHDRSQSQSWVELLAGKLDLGV